MNIEELIKHAISDESIPNSVNNWGRFFLSTIRGSGKIGTKKGILSSANGILAIPLTYLPLEIPLVLCDCKGLKIETAPKCSNFASSPF